MDIDRPSGLERRRRRWLRRPSRSLRALLAVWRWVSTIAFLLVAFSLLALLAANEGVYGPRLRDAVDAAHSSRLAHEAMLDQQTGLRAYLATGDDQFLDAYERGSEALPALNRQTADLVREEPAASNLLFEVRLAQAAWIDGWTGDALAAGRSGGLEGEQAKELLDAGKELFDRYRLAQESLVAELARHGDAAFGGQSSAVLRTAGLALAVTVVFGLIAIGWLHSLERSLDPALESIEAHLERIGRGDLSTAHLFVGPAELARIDEGLSDTAMALSAARALSEQQAERLAEQNRQLAQVIGFARDIAESLSMRSILRGVCAAASAIADERRAVVWLRDGAEPQVTARADSSGPGMEPAGLEPVALGAGVVGRAARYGRVEGHGKGRLAAAGTMDVTLDEGVAVPMVVGAEVIGVLQIVGEGASELPLGTLNVLEALAVQAATAVGSAWLHEHTETLAMTDALTHLPNRRRLEVDLAREVAVAVRHDRPLAFAMIDVDHFKAYNDSLGHQAGDGALQELAGVLAAGNRGGDMAYRYGGGQLCIVMRETDVPGAALHAERLRSAVEHHFAGPPHQRPVTISAGVAGLPLHGMTAEALVTAADAALYEAKQSGRNRVWIASSKEAALTE